MLLLNQDQETSKIEKPRFYGAFLLYLQLNLYPVKSIIVKEIESKSIVWFGPSNQYLVVEPITARIINDISEKKELQTVASELENDLDIPYEKAIDFIIDLEEKLVKPNMDIEKDTYSNKTNFSNPETVIGSLSIIYFHFAMGGRDIKIAFVFPPVCKPNLVPLS